MNYGLTRQSLGDMIDKMLSDGNQNCLQGVWVDNGAE